MNHDKTPAAPITLRDISVAANMPLLANLATLPAVMTPQAAFMAEVKAAVTTAPDTLAHPPLSKRNKPLKAKKAAKADKSAKTFKPHEKLVRHRFTMPKSDLDLVDVLKSRSLIGQRTAKKGELLRAGLRVLSTLDCAALIAALDALPPIKNGRPKKHG